VAEPPEPLPVEEKELLQVLLAEPALAREAAGAIPLDRVRHQDAAALLRMLYDLVAEGALLAHLPAAQAFDLVRARIEDPRLAKLALEMRDIGLQHAERTAWLERILDEFHRKYQVEPAKQELKNQLRAASDDAAALELLRRLQTQPRNPPAQARPVSAMN
jgi:hypothetical protein